MRILQLIDSLEVGGAERMAVNFANALVEKTGFSALAATRKEGSLKSAIDPKVAYLYLNKKKSADISAVLRLRKFCKENRITIVNAHGSSFFTGFLLKLVLPKIKLIWHDHNGDRSSQTRKQNRILWLCSKFFNGIIVVNHKLENWSREILDFKNVIYLPNFTVTGDISICETTLGGTPGKRILYLANMRYPKNHAMVMEVAAKLKNVQPEWSFHLVGKDLDDAYSKEIKAFIGANGLVETVYIYGMKTDTPNIINQCDIAIIASTHEGLPVSLLEYGLYAKAVVVTAVGEIPRIVENGKNGIVVASQDTEGFYNALNELANDSQKRIHFGKALQETIAGNHSEPAVIEKYLKWLSEI